MVSAAGKYGGTSTGMAVFVSAAGKYGGTSTGMAVLVSAAGLKHILLDVIPYWRAKRNQAPAKTRKCLIVRCGRYWIRTSDPLLVRQVL